MTIDEVIEFVNRIVRKYDYDSAFLILKELSDRMGYHLVKK